MRAIFLYIFGVACSDKVVCFVQCKDGVRCDDHAW
jgi:hypothetical protein